MSKQNQVIDFLIGKRKDWPLYKDSIVVPMPKRAKKSKQIKVEVCACEHVGQDDGQYTCWLHHDCRRGDCTHAEDDNES